MSGSSFENDEPRTSLPSESDLERNDAWRVTGASIRGHSHTVKDKPNQDAIGWTPVGAQSSAAVVLAVSDGHGSSRHFRSHIGSQLAVEAALDQMMALTTNQPPVSMVKRIAEEQLPQGLVRKWRELVRAHHDSNPFLPKEWDVDAVDLSDKQRAEVEGNPFIAYGATLIVVTVTPSFILYLQLGDGDVVVVATDGTAHRPLPSDDRLIGNETSSLCMPNAWQEVRFRLVPTSEQAPAMIIATTDGYANSFPDNDDDFLKIGPDYLGMVRSKGCGPVADELPAILSSTSERGSGDDITIGILKRNRHGDHDDLQDRLSILESKVGDTLDQPENGRCPAPCPGPSSPEVSLPTSAAESSARVGSLTSIGRDIAISRYWLGTVTAIALISFGLSVWNLRETSALKHDYHVHPSSQVTHRNHLLPGR